MTSLRKFLEEVGYSQFYLFFGEANLRCRDWVLAAAKLKGPLRVAVSLFLLGESVPMTLASRTLGQETVRGLLQAKILTVTDGRAIAGNFRLLVWRGCFYFCQLPGNAYAYFGEDSLALTQFQSPVIAHRVLDLCSGPGIQAISSAQRGNTVTAVEQSADACRVLRVNLAVNQLEDRVTVVNQRLEDFATTTQDSWDQILCNPPLVPMPGPLQELTVWHGGEDGLAIVQRILELYRSRLQPGGAFEFIGMSLLGEDRFGARNPLKALATRLKWNGRIHLLSRHAIHDPSVLFEMHAATLAQGNRIGLPAARRELATAYAEHSEFFLYYCRLCPSTRGARPRLDWVDMSSSHYGCWFA